MCDLVLAFQSMRLAVYVYVLRFATFLWASSNIGQWFLKSVELRGALAPAIYLVPSIRAKTSDPIITNKLITMIKRQALTSFSLWFVSLPPLVSGFPGQLTEKYCNCGPHCMVHFQIKCEDVETRSRKRRFCWG